MTATKPFILVVEDDSDDVELLGGAGALSLYALVRDERPPRAKGAP